MAKCRAQDISDFSEHYRLRLRILLCDTHTREPDNVGNIYALAGLLLGVYGIGLTRAWQLLGARRFGSFGWLNPLRQIDDGTSTSSQEESKTSNNMMHK